MKIYTRLSKKQWLSSMKENLGSFTTFGEERFTGFFWGSVFRVTYHSGYEWNRKISNQKNTAIGYVKDTDQGCQIRFLYTRGLLYPSAFLLYWGILTVLGLISAVGRGVLSIPALLITAAITFGTMVITAPLSALIESFTDESEEGRKILLTTIIAPDDPCAYTNNCNKV